MSKPLAIAFVDKGVVTSFHWCRRREVVPFLHRREANCSDGDLDHRDYSFSKNNKVSSGNLRMEWRNDWKYAYLSFGNHLVKWAIHYSK